MSNYNRVILMGNLTRDVETRSTSGGKSVSKFGIAVNRRWSQNGETKESVLFIDCVAWGRTGEVVAQFCRKGSPIHIEGRLELQTWEDKNGGGKRSKHEVVVDTVQLLRGGESSKGDAAPQSSGNEYGDIPF